MFNVEFLGIACIILVRLWRFSNQTSKSRLKLYEYSSFLSYNQLNGTVLLNFIFTENYDLFKSQQTMPNRITKFCFVDAKREAKREAEREVKREAKREAKLYSKIKFSLLK